VKPEVDDDNGELLLQRMTQRFNSHGVDIPCSVPCLIELCTSDLQSLPTIERLSHEIVNCLGFSPRPTCCWLDAEVEAFVAGKAIYINLRPILLSRRTYTERELFVYLAAILCHEIAHVQLPAEGHSARHGQLRNDLMARLLLKTNRLLATPPQSIAEAEALVSASARKGKRRSDAASLPLTPPTVQGGHLKQLGGRRSVGGRLRRATFIKFRHHHHRRRPRPRLILARQFVHLPRPSPGVLPLEGQLT
jgi:hypothetical protein